jgi:hypothetical protein
VRIQVRSTEGVSAGLAQADDVERTDKLGDFTTNARVILLSLIALGIGVLGAFVALALLRLIGLFTNLFFFITAGVARWFRPLGTTWALGSSLRPWWDLSSSD